MFAWVPVVTGLLAAIAVRRSLFKSDRLDGGRFDGERFDGERIDSERIDNLIRALLLAAALWAAYLALVSEVLSLFAALRFGPLLGAWALPIPALLMWLHRESPANSRSSPRLYPRSPRPRSPRPRSPRPRSPRPRWRAGVLAAVAGIVAVTGLVALFSAPNTWDSMTYHLPRMMHWAQNGSVAHYPTHEPRQLYLSPWAELVASHFHILGSDRAGRLIQWLAMAGSLLAVSTIAGQLGAGPSGRILSVLVAATIPIGLLQAVSTQTDYAVSFHLLTAVCFLSGAERRTWPHFIGAALATGLAVLTKGTAYVVLAPFLAAFAGRLLRAKRGSAWRYLALFAAVALALNLGHYGRNLRLFGSPLQPRGLGEYHRYGNQTYGLGVAASNATRFAALHLTVPAPALVAESYAAVRRLHRVLGVDPEDPRTTWPGTRFEPPPQLIHEDFSGNFLHAILILICFAAAASARVRRALPGFARHAALVAAGCLLFAVLLNWPPWSTRLHRPLFVRAAPLVGSLLSTGPRYPATAAAVLLVAQAVPFVADNPLHPLTGRHNVFRQPANAQMFRPRVLLGEFYVAAAERVAAAGCSRIAVEMPPDAWEYPLWVVLRQATETPPRLESVSTGNVSRQLLDPGFEPCAVVCLSCAPPSRETHATRFGEAVLAAPDDRPDRAKHLLFLQSPTTGLLETTR